MGKNATVQGLTTRATASVWFPHIVDEQASGTLVAESVALAIFHRPCELHL